MWGSLRLAPITHTGYFGARDAEILRTHTFRMEMRIQLTQEIQYFAIFMSSASAIHIFFRLRFFGVQTVSLYDYCEL